MLTRLEVDGFKNLRDVTLDFGPFTCIAGPNGVGKSNLFDVIEFLSLLASRPIMDAAQQVRRSKDGRTADPRDLFWTDGERYASTVKIAAEIIVPGQVQDAFGREAKATITFLRYEVAFGYERREDSPMAGHLVLRHESLTHINLGDASKHLRFPHRADRFRKRVVTGGRRGGAFISTAREEGVLVTRIHGDGGSRGLGRPAPTEAAPMTVVGTTTQASDPTILAVKREFESWRMLALEPAAMRSSDPFRTPSQLLANGGQLAATLDRLVQRLGADAVYAKIGRDLAELVPVRSLRVDRDLRRELLTIMLTMRDGPELPAKSLSDGTLRFLALCVLEADPEASGLLCMEEPENGIHPARVQAMLALVHRLAVDPDEPPDHDNPMRQVIINTHSPLLVQHQLADRRDDLLVAVEVSIRGPGGRFMRTTRFKPLRDTWRTADGSAVGMLGGTIAEYLGRDDPQLSLLDEAP